MAALRIPVVAIAWVVEQFRRLPGAALVGRNRTLIVIALLLFAGIAFLVWGLERAPQRFTLAQLAAGELSPMQSWIIVSGDIRSEAVRPSRYLYRLTDPAAPNASMIVEANFELPSGWQTISGQYTGTREGVPPGFDWVGYMEAEPVLAPDQPPPWIAIGLASICLLFIAGSRTSYPMFFRESPGGAQRAVRDVRVRIHEAWPATGHVVNGTLGLRVDGPAELQIPGREPTQVRLHSVHTSADVGELRSFGRSEPAVLVHRSTGELVLGFDSRADRDAAYAALVADAQRDLPMMGH